MGEYITRDKSGAPLVFEIKGNAPSDTEMSRISAYMTQGPQTAPQTPTPPQEAPGMLTNFGRGVARGWNEVQAGVDVAGQSLFHALGDQAQEKEWEQAAQAQRAERDTYGSPEGAFLDSNTSKANAIAGTIGQSAPSMVLGYGGMGAGGVAGGYIGGALGTLLDPFVGPAGTVGGAAIGSLIGSEIGGALGYSPQMLNSNAERQIQEHGYVKDWGKAYAATALQAGIETATDKFTLHTVGALADAGKIVGKQFLTKSTEKAIRDASDTAVKKAMTIVAKRVGEGAALSAVSGATEEVLQQGLERWQAELPLMDDKAKKEYLESAIMGGIVESIFGAGAGVYGGVKEAKHAEALNAAKKDIEAEAAAKTTAAQTYAPQYEEKRNAPYIEQPAPTEEQPMIAGQLPDYSGTTYEQKMLEKDETKLPPGLQDTEVGIRPTVLRKLLDLGYTEEDARSMPLRHTEIIADQEITKEARDRGRKKFEELLSPPPPAPTSPHAVPETVGPDGMRLVHGSGDAELTQNRIEIIRSTGQKQGKKGRIYGGFYTHSEADLGHAENYARMMGGTPTVYNVDIHPGTVIHRETGDITRLSQERINELANQGVGVVAGADPRGRTEYAVIQKSAIKDMSPRIAAAASETTQPGSAPVATPVTATPRISEQGPVRKPFNETEYRNAVAALRDEGVLSVDKIAKQLGVSRPVATAYFQEMLDRNDAHPAGNQNQYAKITLPHGMATRKMSDVRGKMKPYRSRDYIVKPVRPADLRPFSVSLNGKKVGNKLKFHTREEAHAWIDNSTIPPNRRKDATVSEDTTGLQYGIHELHYEHLPNKEQHLVGERVVNTYSTEEEANNAIKEYDPAYSPESNKWKQSQTQEQKQAAIEQDFNQSMGPIADKLKAYGEQVLGKGRVDVGILPRITNPDVPDALVEGTSQDIKRTDPDGMKRVIGNLIKLANDIYNPNLTTEQRTQMMEQVFNHELVHALRSLDLLTPKEWDTLFQHAASAKVPGKPYTWLQRAAVRAEGSNPNTLAEEAIAEMVRHYMNDPTTFRNPERGMLRRIADFIKRMIRLGQRHDAADLMDTIFSGGIADRNIGHGGLGPRNADDVHYSLLKDDNFYLDTARFLQGVTRETAPKNDWIKMLSSAGIKDSELNWLGIKQWLQDLPKGEPVHRNDIINFVKASGPKVVPVIFANQEHPDLGQAAVMGPRWVERSQTFKADKTYAEVAFTAPAKPGEPDYYDRGGHMMVPNAATKGMRKLENVIAYARFRDVMKKIGGEAKKILFIEEIQSDLHQQGSMKGYFSKSGIIKLNEMRDQTRAAYDEIRRLEGQKVDISDKIWMLQQQEKQLSAQPISQVREQKLAIQNAITDKMQELVRVGPAISAAKVHHSNMVKEVADFSERQGIPNAPFKSNWEDYVIRRMIRHAVENGYHGISWHGSPESVAVTEGYGELDVTQDEKGRNIYKAFGETPVSPIVNRYLLKLPRITKGIADPFGANLEHSVVQSKERPPTWQPEAWELGIAEPPVTDAAAAIPNPEAMYDFANTLIQDHKDNVRDDLYQNDDERDHAEELVEKLKTAKQVTRSRRAFNPDDILQSVGLSTSDIKHVITWHENLDYYAGLHAAMTETPVKGGVPLDTYDLMFNSAMTESFEKGDQPFFSMVRPQPGSNNRNEQVQYSAAAPTGARVPPAPPPDRLAEVYNNITYDNLSPTLHKLIDWSVPGAARRHRWKEATDTGIISVQDRMLSLGRLIDRMKKNGGFITNENDVYLREQLYSGQTDAHLAANDREFYKPMLNTIQGLNVTRRDFDEARTISPRVAELLDAYKNNPKHALAELYLYAQHAQERNAEMQRRNERLAGERPMQYEAGSGMGNGEAQAVLDWFASKSFAREFNDTTNANSVRSRMRAIVDSTNNVRVSAGLTPDFRTMPHPSGQGMVDNYRDYVPIRGFLAEASLRDEDMTDFAKTGKGFNIRGKEDFAALGRESMGRDLIAHAMMQNQESIVRGGKNKVVQSFRQLILDNMAQMADVAEIMQMPRTKYYYDRESGVVKQVVDNSVMNDPTVLKGKVNGQQFYIKLKDPRMVKAMNTKSGLGSNTGMHALIKGLAKVNRVLAATRTSYNPEFMVANMLRDLQSALINLSESDQKGVRRQMMASVFPALNGIRKSLRSGDMSSEWAKIHEEFRRHGGHTAAFGIRELADAIDNINKHFEEDFSGPMGKVKKPIAMLGKFIEDYNNVIENGTRLAAYKTLRDKYLELTGDPHDPQNQLRAKEMAAFAAKNLTVNFNMGGESKPVLNAFYLFFNAGMQGSMALLNPFIRSRRMKYLWAGVLTAGAIQDMMMSLLSPEDDDGEKTYDKIPDYVLEHNMVFMDPFGISKRGYFKVPMPYLMNGIYNWGRSAARMARGKYTAGQMMYSGGMTLLDSLNPLGGSNSFLNFVAPSIIDPIVDLYQNEDFTGKPVAPPVSPYDNVGENRSQQYWNNTNPAYVTIADWLSRLTGRQGDYIPGKVEASPNQVQYVMDWVTGGTGTFLARAGSIMYSGAQGQLPEEFSAGDIPFARKAYGQITAKNDLQDYIQGRDQVLRIRKALQDARKQGDNELYMKIMRDYPNEYKAANRINAIENGRRKLGAKIKKIRDSRLLSDERKAELIKSMKDRQNTLVGRGNQEMAAAGVD